jgi:hypothetical protein
MSRSLPVPLPIWRSPNGEVVACVEKLKVMKENIEELTQMAQDVLEDAILIGCDEHQVRAYLMELMGALDNPYCSKKAC